MCSTGMEHESGPISFDQLNSKTAGEMTHQALSTGNKNLSCLHLSTPQQLMVLMAYVLDHFTTSMEVVPFNICTDSAKSDG